MSHQHEVNATLVVDVVAGPDPHLRIVREGGDALRIELSEVARLLGALAGSATDFDTMPCQDTTEVPPQETRMGYKNEEENENAPPIVVDRNAIFWATLETLQEASSSLNRLVNKLTRGQFETEEVLARRDLLISTLTQVLYLTAETLHILQGMAST